MVQIYLNEVNYPKTQRQLRNQLLLASVTTTKRTFKKPNLCQDIVSYGKGYFQISNVHCVHNITSTERRYYERIIWLLLLIATTGTCLYVYKQFTDLYYEQRLVTLVDNSMEPIYIVPFPSIGVCPTNRINWPKLMVAHQLFLPSNATAESIQTFRQFFGILSDFHFGKFNELQALMNPKLNLSLLANVDIKAVMAHVSFTCDELFQQPCFWREKPYNCCQLFELELTEYGFCWVFNSLISEKSLEKQRKSRFYPYHNSFIGEGTGLDVMVNLDESKQQPNLTTLNGVYVLIKRPEKYSGSSRFVPYDTYTRFPVNPQISRTDASTRVLEPEERKCFLDASEQDHPLFKTLPGLEYGAANCYVRCRQEYVYKKCNCNLSLCFPQYADDNMTACKAKDYRCLYENWEFFSFEYHVTEHAREYLEIGNNSYMECNCLSDCKKIVYETNPINMPLDGLSTKSDVKVIHLDVHYASVYMISYRTSMNYTFVELLGSLGGIFGLFLGASLLSAVELFYYFTIGLFTHLYDRGYRFNGLFFKWKRKAKLTKSRRLNVLRRHSIFSENTKQFPVYYLRR